MPYTSLLLNATFVRRTRPVATEQGIRGQVTQDFLCPSQILLCPIYRKHTQEQKSCLLKMYFLPQALEPDYGPAKNDRLGESC